MKVITAYETEDGELFRLEHEAAKHEDKRRVADDLRSFADDAFWSGISTRDIGTLLVENRAVLRDILNRLPT